MLFSIIPIFKRGGDYISAVVLSADFTKPAGRASNVKKMRGRKQREKFSVKKTHYIYIVGIKYLDEPLRRNYSRLVPDSLSNHRYYFALLSIEHFLHCSLAALMAFFSFDQPIACLLIFFNWYDKVGLFFFSTIYFFLLDCDSFYIFIFKSRAII